MYASTASPAAVSATPQGSPFGTGAGASSSSDSWVSDGATGLERSASPLTAEEASGATASSVSAAARGSGVPAPRNSAASPSNGSPVRSPRRCRKKSSATTEPSVVDTAVEIAASAESRAGPRPAANSPGRGRVLGSVRATATANWTVAASGTAHHSSRATDSDARAGCPEAYPSVHRSRKPTPADAAASSRRRIRTRGCEPRVRRRASTPSGLPYRTRRAGRRW